MRAFTDPRALLLTRRPLDHTDGGHYGGHGGMMGGMAGGMAGAYMMGKMFDFD